MKVRQTKEGEFILINEYDGRRLAGPFEHEDEAYAAMRSPKQSDPLKQADSPKRRGRPPKKTAPEEQQTPDQ